MTNTIEGLRETIEGFLKEANIAYSPLGERFRVSRGTAAVFLKAISWTEGHTMVELLCPVLRDVECTEALLKRLNDMNLALYFGKAYWHDHGVWLAHNLLGDHVDAGELVAAVGTLATVADHVDDELKQQFGGRRWHEG